MRSSARQSTCVWLAWQLHVVIRGWGVCGLVMVGKVTVTLLRSYASELRVLILVRSRSKCQRQRPAKRVGSGLRSLIGPLASPPWDPRLPELVVSEDGGVDGCRSSSARNCKAIGWECYGNVAMEARTPGRDLQLQHWPWRCRSTSLDTTPSIRPTRVTTGQDLRTVSSTRRCRTA